MVWYLFLVYSNMSWGKMLQLTSSRPFLVFLLPQDVVASVRWSGTDVRTGAIETPVNATSVNVPEASPGLSARRWPNMATVSICAVQ